MPYLTVTDETKQEHIDWLNNVKMDLEGLEEDPTIKNLFPGSDRGDVGTVKDIVGIFLATLTNQEVTID